VKRIFLAFAVITALVISLFTPIAWASIFTIKVDISDNIIALGDTTQLKVTLTNSGDTETETVKVIVGMNIADIEVVKSDATFGAFDIKTYTWLIGNMDPGKSAVLTLTVKGKVEGAHDITFSLVENNIVIHTKRVYIGVEEEPDIDVTLSTPKSINFALGETPYLQVVVLNRGGEARNVKVSLETDKDIMPIGKASCSQGSFTGSIWNIGTMGKKETEKCLIQIMAKEEGTYGGVIKVVSPVSDTNPANDELALSFNVKRQPNTTMVLIPVNPIFTSGDNLYVATIITVKGPSAEKDLSVSYDIKGGKPINMIVSTGIYRDGIWTLGNVKPGIYFGILKVQSHENIRSVSITGNLKSAVSTLKKSAVFASTDISDIAVIMPDDKNSLDTADAFPLPIVVLNQGTTVASGITVNFKVIGGKYNIIDYTAGGVVGTTWKIDKLQPGSSASLYVEIINTTEGAVSVEASVVAKTKTKDVNMDNNSSSWTGYFEDKGSPNPPIVKKIGTYGRNVEVIIVTPADKDLSRIYVKVEGREIFSMTASPGTSYLETIKLPSDGNFNMEFYAEDTFDNSSTPAIIPVSVDITPPYTIWNISQKGIISSSPYNVKGITEPGASLLIRVKAGNLREAYYKPNIDEEGKFSFPLYLYNGINEICLFATDKASNTYERCSVISYPKPTIISFTVGKKKAYIDNKPYLLEVSAANIGGTTYVPVRFLAEAMNMSLAWYGMERKIEMSLGDTNLILYLDKPYAIVNGRQVKLRSKLPVIQGRSLVPARFISETFGARVQWLPSTKTVKIIYP